MGTTATVADDVAALAYEYNKLTEDIKRAEELRKVVAGELLETLEREGIASVLAGHWKVTRVDAAGRETLDEGRLLESGVSADQIAAARVKGKPYSFVKVTAVNHQP